MPLAGLRLLARQVAQLGASHWHNAELVKQVATTLGESAAFVGAWHDNVANDGATVVSRDCGLMQVNIPARLIGTESEAQLRTENMTYDVAIRVARANVEAAYQLYEQPWAREPGEPQIRRWEPWVAYTSGIATFPEFWVWHQVNGKPVGPWVQTGRYVQQAIAGVANFHLMIKRDKTLEQALELATAYAVRFGVKAPAVESRGLVTFRVPQPPGGPPLDGIGPRPVPNDGA